MKALITVLLLCWSLVAAPAQAGEIRGRVTDATGAGLPGVTMEARPAGAAASRLVAVTGEDGRYVLSGVANGTYEVRASLLNFATFVARHVVVRTGEPTVIDARLTLAVNADVTVTGRSSFTNLADVEDPAANLIGVAFAASQGAVTARQLEARPIMRAGEVLESVPGVIVSQHSGEGKANQYYLRGFNLDHGTDFATTVAGMPVNLPTHGHGHGYSDTNFLIPELVSGVQYSKGPYFAELGDFSAAGAATINYTNTLDRPIVAVGSGENGWRRALLAGSPQLGNGHLLYALELGTNDGPWIQPDDYKKVNVVLRYSHGDARNGFSLTGLGYRASWQSTDQIPERAVAAGMIDRFGTIDTTDGGETSRYAVVADWQGSASGSVTRATAFAFHYGVNLFSNFTYALDDPENGDQFEQTDSRFVTGGRVTHRRLGVWGGRTVEHTYGTQLRHDAIGNVGLYHTRQRQRLSTVREDSVGQTSGALFYANRYQWSRLVRSELGIRADLYHFRVNSDTPANSGTNTSGIVSPKAGVVIGPMKSTEFYANAGVGFHSNDARGTTITIDPGSGDASPTLFELRRGRAVALAKAEASRVTPLVRARGAEIGMRTVAVPRTQLTVTFWTLALDSELLFVGDAGTTEASRPSRRTGIEATAYFRPRRWLTLDTDLAASRARFANDDPSGRYIPGSVQTVISGGVSVDAPRGLFASARLRYFGPRPLIEDGSVRSQSTSLVNVQGGYRLFGNARVVADVFNLFDRTVSDIDYFYRSRLPGEPAAGVEDVHLHPALPRSVRVSLQVGF